MRQHALRARYAIPTALALWTATPPAGGEVLQACGPIRLTASNATANAIFGRSMALDGDTLIVGAENARTAYIFRWTGSSWEEEARLVPHGDTSGSGFAFAVALDGDTALIGAYADDLPGGNDHGSVYVYTRIGNDWVQQAQLTASDARPDDWFGFAVAIDGDTALIGSFLDDGPTAEGQGSAYVFTRSGDEWTEEVKVLHPDAAFGGYFGRSVVIEDDTMLIGARRGSGVSESNEGIVYVFTRTGSVWVQEDRLTASDAAPHDEFGITLALDGDTALIGTPRDDNEAGVNAGAVYVFTRDGVSWTPQEKLAHPDAARNDAFGARVALEGDTAVIYAGLRDGVEAHAIGSARVFQRTASGWEQRGMLRAPNTQRTDVFGSAVALVGDLAVVAAYGYDGPAGDSQGAVYVFQFRPADLNFDGPIDGADLGILLGAWGQPGATDLNADGVTDDADLGLLLAAWGSCPERRRNE